MLSTAQAITNRRDIHIHAFKKLRHRRPLNNPHPKLMLLELSIGVSSIVDVVKSTGRRITDMEPSTIPIL